MATDEGMMKPIILVMNVATASVGSLRFLFIRARSLPWHLIRPLFFRSLAALFGGAIRPTPGAYVVILGAVLLVVACVLSVNAAGSRGRACREVTRRLDDSQA